MNVGDRPYAVENATVEKQLLNTWMVHHKPDPNPNPNPIPHPGPHLTLLQDTDLHCKANPRHFTK